MDEDGNDYIDYVCSYGPGILGHAYPAVIEAVKQACEQGLTFGAPTKKEYEIASLIHDMMPSMEMMRMVNSGTEAVMSAIRVARGYTGKDYIVKFKGCYHGHSDGLLVKAGSAALLQAVPDSAGVPKISLLILSYSSTEPSSLPDFVAKIISTAACTASLCELLPSPMQVERVSIF